MFDRVFVINLDRRPDRWEQFQKRFPADWPFAKPERFAAVDGAAEAVPAYFHGPAGAWGCFQTHHALWKLQMAEGWDSVLILEDDAVFSRNAVAVMRETMNLVPDDWEQIYFGGQYQVVDSPPPVAVVQDKLVRCRSVNRTHAYAIRVGFAAVCADHLTQTPWPENARLHHVDYRLGELHDSHQVYAPWRFCVGQARGTSDVRTDGRRHYTVEHWWNQYPIINRETAGVV